MENEETIISVMTDNMLLKAKNQALENRLNKAIELPLGVGDTVYVIETAWNIGNLQNGESYIAEYNVVKIEVTLTDNVKNICFSLREKNNEGFNYFYLDELDVNGIYFSSKEKAEAFYERDSDQVS